MGTLVLLVMQLNWGFGVQIVSDTCWCMLGEVVPAPLSVMPTSAQTLITNSAKYAHYAPGLVGRQVRFASLAGCVEAACNRHVRKSFPRWLSAGGYHAQSRTLSMRRHSVALPSRSFWTAANVASSIRRVVR